MTTRFKAKIFQGTAALIVAAHLQAPLNAADRAPAAEAVADEPQGDIVVTAQRRESKLQDTPLAVNALGQDALADQGFRRINDLAGLAAGVNIPNGSLGTQAIFIRGIGTSRPIGNASVGLYIDDVYIPRSFGAGWYGALPDIERVEILHGPQGTLYGQNTSAGAVKFISAAPEAQSRAWGEVGYGNRNSYDARGYAGGALTDTLSGSVAGSLLRQGNVEDNVTLGQRVGQLRNVQGRAKLAWKPADGTRFELSGDYLRDRSDYRTSDPRNVVGAAPYRTFSEIDPQQRYDGGGVTLHASQDLSDDVSIRSITAWRKFHMFLPTDTDGKVGYIAGFNQDIYQNQISEELQLLGTFGRFTLTAGALAYREHFDVYRLTWSNNAFSIIDSNSRNTSLGVYAQGDYKLTDTLTVTVGGRLGYERNEMDVLGYRSNIAGAKLATTFDVQGLKKDFTTFVPKVGLSFKASPQTLVYANFSQGRTSGGWNTAPGNAAVARVPIGQEKVTAYEGGIKSGTRNKAVQGSLAVFYNKYDDYQGSITNPIINGQIVTGAVVQNAGSAHIYGAEFELAVRPVKRVSAQFSLAYLHSAFDSYNNPTGAASTNYVGEDLPFVPEWSGGLTLNYEVPLANDGKVRVSASGRRETSSYSQITATRELTKFPAQTYVDGNAFLTLPGGHWTLSVEVRNLFDKAYALPVSGAYAPAQGLDGVTYSQPRTVMGRVRYDF